MCAQPVIDRNVAAVYPRRSGLVWRLGDALLPRDPRCYVTRPQGRHCKTSRNVPRIGYVAFMYPLPEGRAVSCVCAYQNAILHLSVMYPALSRGVD